MSYNSGPMKVNPCTEAISSAVAFQYSDEKIDFLLNNCQSRFTLKKIDMSQYFEAVIKVNGAELCCRIIGRQGINVRYLRVMTSTTINSPKIRHNSSDHKFVIRSAKLSDVKKAILAILMLADYHTGKMEERLTLKSGHVRLDVPIMPQLVTHLKANRGQFLIDLREQLEVNIISPKQFDDNPQFTIIGEQHNVNLAAFCLAKRAQFLLQTIFHIRVCTEFN